MEIKKTSQKAQATPFHVFLSNAMNMANITNVEVARRLGYAKPNVIAMMRNGSMKVPINKISDLASMLGLDKVALLQRALLSYSPELWDALKSILGDRLLSKNEMALLEVIRGKLHGADIDMTRDDVFVAQLEAMVARAIDRQTRTELRPLPDSKMRDSRVAKLNSQMNSLLARQAEEREKLNDELVKVMEAEQAKKVA